MAYVRPRGAYVRPPAGHFGIRARRESNLGRAGWNPQAVQLRYVAFEMQLASSMETRLPPTPAVLAGLSDDAQMLGPGLVPAKQRYMVGHAQHLAAGASGQQKLLPAR